jgi:peptidylprolyl isomerase
VVEGQDVVNKIVQGDTIQTVKIVRVGDKAKAFKGDETDFQKFSKKT